MAHDVHIHAYFSPDFGVIYQAEITVPTPFPWPVEELGKVATDMVARMLEHTAEVHPETDDDGQGPAPDA